MVGQGKGASVLGARLGDFGCDPRVDVLLRHLASPPLAGYELWLSLRLSHRLHTRLRLLGDLRRFDAVHRVRVLALAFAGKPAEEHADVPEVVRRGQTHRAESVYPRTVRGLLAAALSASCHEAMNDERGERRADATALAHRARARRASRMSHAGYGSGGVG
jgi:hypothetical protein